MSRHAIHAASSHAFASTHAFAQVRGPAAVSPPVPDHPHVPSYALASIRAAIIVLPAVLLLTVGAAPGASTAPVGTGPAAGPATSAAASVAAKPGPRVWMTAKPAKVRVGNHLSVRIKISNGVDLGSVPFHVTYDPKVLRFERGTEGAFMRAGGRETAFFAAPTSSGDELVVGLSRLGRGNGAGGNGELCTLQFTAIGRGDAKLKFTAAKARDSENAIVSSDFQAARIKVR